MPDGRTVIMGGLDERGYGDKNEDLDLFTPSRSRGGRGRIAQLGGSGVLGNSGKPPVGDYYPHLFWMPSGHGLVAGPWTIDTWWFSPPGKRPRLRWQDLPNVGEPRLGHRGDAPGGPDGSHQVELLGGSDKPKADSFEPDQDALATDSVSVFDERRPQAGWRDAGSVRRGALHHPRSHANTVLLPDGSMVEVGGGWGDKKLGGENGAPGQWAAAPPPHDHRAVEPAQPHLAPGTAAARVPHLPLDRVAAARRPRGLGGRRLQRPLHRRRPTRNFTQDSAEIYEPPYLFDGNRQAPRPSCAAPRSGSVDEKRAGAREVGARRTARSPGRS